MSSSENGKRAGNLAVRRGFFNSEAQSRRRLNQICSEQDMAKQLEKDGYEVFSPTVVCDRIAIKDGKVYFVEFKKHGQVLRESQQKVFNIAKDNYIIIYK